MLLPIRLSYIQAILLLQPWPRLAQYFCKNRSGNNEKSRTRAGEESGEKKTEEEEPIIEYALKVVTRDPDKKDEAQGLDVELGQVYMLYNDVFYPTQAGRIPVGGIYRDALLKRLGAING